MLRLLKKTIEIITKTKWNERFFFIKMCNDSQLTLSMSAWAVGFSFTFSIIH